MNNISDIEIPDEFKQTSPENEEEDIVEQYRNQLAYSSDRLIGVDANDNYVVDFRTIIILVGLIVAYESESTVQEEQVTSTLEELGVNLTLEDILNIEKNHKALVIPYGKSLSPAPIVFENLSSGVLLALVSNRLGVVAVRPRGDTTDDDILDDIKLTLEPALNIYQKCKQIIINTDTSVSDKVRATLEELDSFGEYNDPNS